MATILQPPALKIDGVLYSGGQQMPTSVRLDRRIVWNLLAHLAAAGWTPTETLSDESVTTTTPEAVMEEVFNLDESRVLFCKGNERTHWVLLIGGNGVDCISDYSYAKADDGFRAAMEAFDPDLFA